MSNIKQLAAKTAGVGGAGFIVGAVLPIVSGPAGATLGVIAYLGAKAASNTRK